MPRVVAAAHRGTRVRYVFSLGALAGAAAGLEATPGSLPLQACRSARTFAACPSRLLHGLLEPLALTAGAGGAGALALAALVLLARGRGAVAAGGRREAIPERVRHEVWRRDGGACVDCRSRERLEFDHIIPLARGGSSTPRNLELRCERCNRRKGARI